MTIAVTCSCGKRFAAQPHLAGKQVRCPGCQSPLTIPGAAPAAPITVACQCGKRFSAKPELAGKQIRCPSCQSPLKIPGGQQTQQAPIAVTCQCGQRFQAPPHLLGKQVRCPVCQQALLVSGAPAPTIAPQQQPQPAPAASTDDDLWGDLPTSFAPAPIATNLPAAPAAPAVDARKSSIANEYLAKAYAEESGRKQDEESWGNGKIISGIAMIVGSMIWFCGGLAFGILFFYPPVLFIFGVIALINGISQKMSR